MTLAPWERKLALTFAAMALLLAVATCYAQAPGAKRYTKPWTLEQCDRAAGGIVRANAVFNVSTGDGRWVPTCAVVRKLLTMTDSGV